jgi:hypothetical protein
MAPAQNSSSQREAGISLCPHAHTYRGEIPARSAALRAWNDDFGRNPQPSTKLVIPVRPSARPPRSSGERESLVPPFDTLRRTSANTNAGKGGAARHTGESAREDDVTQGTLLDLLRDLEHAVFHGATQRALNDEGVDNVKVDIHDGMLTIQGDRASAGPSDATAASIARSRCRRASTPRRRTRHPRLVRLERDSGSSRRARGPE